MYLPQSPDHCQINPKMLPTPLICTTSSDKHQRVKPFSITLYSSFLTYMILNSSNGCHMWWSQWQQVNVFHSVNMINRYTKPSICTLYSKGNIRSPHLIKTIWDWLQRGNYRYFIKWLQKLINIIYIFSSVMEDLLIGILLMNCTREIWELLQVPLDCHLFQCSNMSMCTWPAFQRCGLI